jgi:hypothetical protein
VPFKLGLNGKQVASGKSKGKKDLSISLANKCHFLLVKPDSPPIYEVVPTKENLFCSYLEILPQNKFSVTNVSS